MVNTIKNEVLVMNNKNTDKTSEGREREKNGFQIRDNIVYENDKYNLMEGSAKIKMADHLQTFFCAKLIKPL